MKLYCNHWTELIILQIDILVVPLILPPLSMLKLIREHLIRGRSAVFINTKQRSDQVVEPRILKLSLDGTPASSPSEDIHLSPKVVLPVVGNVGQHSPETPHISRGRDVTTFPENLRCQVADSPTHRVCVLVHSRGRLT